MSEVERKRLATLAQDEAKKKEAAKAKVPPPQTLTIVSTDDATFEKFKGERIENWEAFLRFLIQVKMPEREIEEIARTNRQERKADTFTIFDPQLNPFPGAMVNAIIAQASALPFKIVLVTNTAATGNDKVKVVQHHSGAKRRANGQSAQPARDDPTGGFGKVVLRKPGGTYVDPSVTQDERLRTVCQVLGLTYEEGKLAADAFEAILMTVLSSFNARKHKRPVVMTPVNILLLSLAAASRLNEEDEAFKGRKTKVAPFFWDPSVCSMACTILKQPRKEASASELNSSRLAQLTGGGVGALNDVNLGVVTSDNVLAVLNKPGMQYSHVDWNFILFLLNLYDRRSKSDAKVETFLKFEYTTASVTKQRSWFASVITKRIQKLADLSEVPQCCVTADYALAEFVQDDKDEFAKNLVIQPALYGFRAYIGNLKGRAKLAGKVISAMGATITHDRVSYSRMKLLKVFINKVVPEQAENALTFVSRCNDEDFRRHIIGSLSGEKLAECLA